MMLNKTKKLIKGLSATALAVGISGCGSSMTDDNDRIEGSSSYSNETVEKTTQKSVQVSEIPPMPPSDAYCDEYEWDMAEEYYECVDIDSDYYHHYYYGKGFYRTAHDIRKRNKPVFVIGSAAAATNTADKNAKKPEAPTEKQTTSTSKSTTSSKTTKENTSAAASKSSSASKSGSFSNSSSTSKSSGFGSSSSSFGG
ncbi:hypothetical protein [Bacillus sp. AK031]